MIHEMERANMGEAQWRQTVDQLRLDIDGLQHKISLQQAEQNQQVVDLAAKDESLTVELKLRRNENLAMKQDNQALFDKLTVVEQMMEDKDQ